MNQIFMLLLAGISAAGLFARALVNPVEQSQGWLPVSVIVFLGTVISPFLFPELAGYIALTVWFLLILLPSLGFRLLQRAVSQSNYVKARRLVNLIRLLHPWFEWPVYLDMLKAYELAANNDKEGILAILERHKNAQTPLGQVMALRVLQLTREWTALLDWSDSMLDPTQNGKADRLSHLLSRRKEMFLLPAVYGRIHALGALGNLNELLETFTQHRPLLARSPSIARQCALLTLAYCGKPEEIRHLFRQELAADSHESYRLWLAIADWAAGEKPSAREQLTRLSQSKNANVRSSVERVLAKPPVEAATVLQPQAQAILSQIENEFEQAIRYRKGSLNTTQRPVGTYILLGANVAAYLGELWLGGSENARVLYQMGALVPGVVLQTGEWWRLISASFLHVGLMHLLLNMLALLWLGTFVESALGLIRFLLVYFLASLGAMLFVLFLVTVGQHPENTLIAGASGSIMGLLGAKGAVLLRGWFQEKSRFAWKYLMEVLVIVAVQSAIDLLIPAVSFVIHFAGVILGFGCASLLQNRT